MIRIPQDGYEHVEDKDSDMDGPRRQQRTARTRKVTNTSTRRRGQIITRLKSLVFSIETCKSHITHFLDELSGKHELKKHKRRDDNGNAGDKREEEMMREGDDECFPL